MRTNLSSAMQQSLFPQETGEVIIQLLEVSHPAFSTVRVCDNNADIVSNVSDGITSQTYSAYGFELSLNDEDEGQVPSPVLVIDNTDLSIMQAIRQATGSRTRIQVKYMMIIASQPNSIQIGPINYQVSEITADQNTIQASLILALLVNEMVPYHTACPQNWLGLFGLNSI